MYIYSSQKNKNNVWSLVLSLCNVRTCSFSGGREPTTLVYLLQNRKFVEAEVKLRKKMIPVEKDHKPAFISRNGSNNYVWPPACTHRRWLYQMVQSLLWDMLHYLTGGTSAWSRDCVHTCWPQTCVTKRSKICFYSNLRPEIIQPCSIKHCGPEVQHWQDVHCIGRHDYPHRWGWDLAVGPKGRLQV